MYHNGFSEGEKKKKKRTEGGGKKGKGHGRTSFNLLDKKGKGGERHPPRKEKRKKRRSPLRGGGGGEEVHVFLVPSIFPFERGKEEKKEVGGTVLLFSYLSPEKKKGEKGRGEERGK